MAQVSIHTHSFAYINVYTATDIGTYALVMDRFRSSLILCTSRGQETLLNPRILSEPTALS